ncbi:MAG TPA: immunoglobulin domain-containing protein [Opitutaceae bacterium]
MPPLIIARPVSRNVPAGGTATFSVEATGNGELAYQWKRDGLAIPGATSPTLDLAAVSPADSGDYTVEATDAGGTTTSRFARLVVAMPVDGRLVNLSIRGVSGATGGPLIVGFVVEGGAKDLLVRGIGPSLEAFGVAGALADPRLTIYADAGIVTENDDWATGGVTSLQAAFHAVGAFALAEESLDASVRADLHGPHTVHVAGKSGAAGVTLVEVYDAGPTQSSRLVNLSARNHVGSGDDVLVAGFILGGNNPRKLLIRGIGTGLEQFGVEGFLEDPAMEVHTLIDDVDTVVAVNDNWGGEPNAASAAIAVPGAFALAGDSRDAVLLITLPATAYTVVVRGRDGATGEALLEVYEVP